MSGTNFLGPKFYNKLPASVKELSLRDFKSRVRNFLIKKAYYDVAEFLNEDVLEFQMSSVLSPQSSIRNECDYMNVTKVHFVYISTSTVS